MGPLTVCGTPIYHRAFALPIRLVPLGREASQFESCGISEIHFNRLSTAIVAHVVRWRLPAQRWHGICAEALSMSGALPLLQPCMCLPPEGVPHDQDHPGAARHAIDVQKLADRSRLPHAPEQPRSTG